MTICIIISTWWNGNQVANIFFLHIVEDGKYKTLSTLKAKWRRLKMSGRHNSDCLSVKEALQCADTTGQQVTITLKSCKTFEGCIVERLWPTSCRVWLNPTDRDDIDKAIVAIHAVDSVDFDTCECR